MKSIATLLILLGDLSYLYFHNDSMVLLKETVERYSQGISRFDKKTREKIITIIEPHKEDIVLETYESIYQNLSSFRVEANEITSENEGVVVKLKDTYGFISNSSYSYKKGLYFSKFNADSDIAVGDRVTFEKYIYSSGETARKVRKCK